jgi:hypothetical protein
VRTAGAGWVATDVVALVIDELVDAACGAAPPHPARQAHPSIAISRIRV